jgi:predicted component of type VI protein secretion system
MYDTHTKYFLDHPLLARIVTVGLHAFRETTPIFPPVISITSREEVHDAFRQQIRTMSGLDVHGIQDPIPLKECIDRQRLVDH